MAFIEIIGNLGADAVVTQGRASEYLSCRVCERNGNEETPAWYNVRCFDAFTVKHIGPHLKKGSYVLIRGKYKDNLWLDKNNVQQIGRDINAFSIEFVNSGRGSGSGEAKEQTPQQTNQPAAQPTQPAAQKPPVRKPAPAPAPAPEPQYDYNANDDDLPF